MGQNAVFVALFPAGFANDCFSAENHGLLLPARATPSGDRKRYAGFAAPSAGLPHGSSPTMPVRDEPQTGTPRRRARPHRAVT